MIILKMGMKNITNNTMIVFYTLRAKILINSYIFIIFSFCLYALFTSPSQYECFLAIPLLALCVYGWLSFNSFRLEVGESKIVRATIIWEKEIDYKNVIGLVLYPDYIKVKSENVTIKIGIDLERRDEAISFILGKLKSRKQYINAKGDEKMIADFYGS